MTKRKQNFRSRNPFHDHPLMRKGGVHEKSVKAIRKADKQKLKREWCSSIALTKVLLKNTIPMGL